MMYVQILSFDGPRSAELVAASRRAGIDRLAPLLRSSPAVREGILGSIHGVAPDGAECHVLLARDEATLEEVGRLVSTSELLPGEDPALLPGPDRYGRFEITDVSGPLATLVAEVAR